MFVLTASDRGGHYARVASDCLLVPDQDSWRIQFTVMISQIVWNAIVAIPAIISHLQNSLFSPYLSIGRVLKINPRAVLGMFS